MIVGWQLFKFQHGVTMAIIKLI